MVARYLVLVDRCPPRLARKIAQATVDGALALRCRIGELAVLSNAACNCLVLPHDSGVVLGTLFPRHGPARQLGSDDLADMAAIGSGSLETLASRYWGSYLCCRTTGDTVTIARDPSGGMPCYYVSSKSDLSVASDARLLVGAGLLQPSFDWEEMPRYLSCKDLPCDRTGILGLRELLSGTSLTYGASGYSSAPYWSPWDHVGADPDWRDDAVRERLRRTIDSCIGAWRSCFDLPLVTISGGLDSSVVLSSLAHAGLSPSCITISGDDPHGDETVWARMMAAAVGASLHEDRYDLADVDLARSVTAHLPKPCGRIHELAYNAPLARHVRMLGADVVMTGNGGDNVFYNSGSVRPLLDRFLSQGLTMGTFATLDAVSEVTRAGHWRVVKEAIRLARRARRPYQWLRELDFLTPETRAVVENATYDHAWLDGPRDALPGKKGHVAMILRMQNHIEGYLRAFDIPMVNPLTSQPIVEMCLGLPTWRTMEGGVDRAIVREAFASRLPDAVLARRSKGGPAGFAMSVIDGKADEVRTRLLDGELVRRGFLDRIALERALARGPAMGLGYMRILSFLDVEAWLENWRVQSTDTVDH